MYTYSSSSFCQLLETTNLPELFTNKNSGNNSQFVPIRLTQIQLEEFVCFRQWIRITTEINPLCQVPLFEENPFTAHPVCHLRMASLAIVVMLD